MVQLQGALATVSSPPGSPALVDAAGNNNKDISGNGTSASAGPSNGDNSSKKWERAVRVLQAQLSQLQASHYRQIADQSDSNHNSAAGGGGGVGGAVNTGSSSSGLIADTPASVPGLAPGSGSGWLDGSLKGEIESLLNGELLEQMDTLTVQNNTLNNELKVR